MKLGGSPSRLVVVDRPLVSIVTPSFNQARFIRETIESVLSQDYPHIEYIIMDGASSDDTAEVVKPYLDRLTFVSEKDRGQSHAINKGFARARGEIVAWLNSDDVFLPGAVSRAVDAFRANPEAAVVYGEGYQIDIDGRLKSRFPHTRPFDLWSLVFFSDYILQQTVFFRKSALDVVGPVREDLHYVMDWDILIRLGKRFDFVYVPEYMGSLREYGEAKTFVGGKKRIREIRDVLREHTGLQFPPGYIVYGLDTYSQIWAGWFDRWPAPLQPVARVLRGLTLRLAHQVIGRVATGCQGRYADGWIGKSASFMLRSGNGEVLISGVVPDVDDLRGQRITVKCEGRTCYEKELRAGEFSLRFGARQRGNDGVTFQVAFKKTFVPAEHAGSTDQRRLGAIVRDFRWAGELPPSSGEVRLPPS